MAAIVPQIHSQAPSQGCNEETASEASDALASQQSDVQRPLRGLRARRQPCAGPPDQEPAPRTATPACSTLRAAASLRKGAHGPDDAGARKCDLPLSTSSRRKRDLRGEGASARGMAMLIPARLGETAQNQVKWRCRGMIRSPVFGWLRSVDAEKPQARPNRQSRRVDHCSDLPG